MLDVLSGFLGILLTFVYFSWVVHLPFALPRSSPPVVLFGCVSKKILFIALAAAPAMAEPERVWWCA